MIMPLKKFVNSMFATIWRTEPKNKKRDENIERTVKICADRSHFSPNNASETQSFQKGT